MSSRFLMSLRDSWDVVRHVRDPRQLVLGLVPPRYRTPIVLNMGADRLSTHSDLPERLRRLGSRLKAVATDDRGRLRYAALKESDLYRDLVMTAASLGSFDLARLEDDNARLAFWLNIYNVLAIHGVIALGIRESVMEVPSFFGVVAYRIGGQIYSLDEIENGMVRANSLHPVSGRRPFASGDPRRKYSVRRVDPRVHAALVCASRSCPAVRFYARESLDQQLEAAAVTWVDGDVAVNDSRKRIELPITYWYFRADFGGEAGIRSFIRRHSTGRLNRRLEDTITHGYPLHYGRYDWSLNRIV